MTGSSPSDTLDFYRRDGCTLCDEARQTLQQVLEERVKRGETVPRVRVINLTQHPDLEAAYGERIPVIAIGGQELSLAPGYRQIESLLDRVLGRLA
jgi:glutaredoxin